MGQKSGTYMKIAFRKIIAAIVAFIVLAFIATLTGSLEGIYQSLFPHLSESALANIEAISNIVGLVLAIFISIRVYKRLAKTAELRD